MNDLPLVSLTIFLPLSGCLFILMIRGESPAAVKNTRAVAFLASLATFAMATLLALNFNSELSDFQLEEQWLWMPYYNIAYHVGIDGISLPLILLTALLMPLSLLATWHSIEHRVK